MGQQGAIGNSTDGYFAGGKNPANAPSYARSTLYKLTYSSETTATLPTAAALTAVRRYMSAVGNTDAGYFVAGYDGSPISKTDKITYSSDTTAAVPGANSTQNRSSTAATGNTDAGYIAGGTPAPTPGRWSIVDKLTYASETTVLVPGANLVRETYGFAATGNGSFGFFGGGAGATRSEMNKMTYSNDTMASVPSAYLSTGKRNLAATGNTDAGYFSGGETPSAVSTTEKVTFSTDTIETVSSAALSGVRTYHAAVSNPSTSAGPVPVNV
jgi:hypothetical protein